MRRQRKSFEDRNRLILEMHNGGMGIRAIGRYMNMSHEGVRKVIKKNEIIYHQRRRGTRTRHGGVNLQWEEGENISRE